MKFILSLLIIPLFLLSGCISNVDNNVHTNSIKLIDPWENFITGVKNSTIIFTYPRAILTYIISNVKIFDSRPEESDRDIFDKLGVTIFILRWSF